MGYLAISNYQMMGHLTLQLTHNSLKYVLLKKRFKMKSSRLDPTNIVPKFWDIKWTSQLSKWKSIWEYWNSFSCILTHLWKCVWIIRHIPTSLPLSCFNFGNEPKIKVTTPWTFNRLEIYLKLSITCENLSHSNHQIWFLKFSFTTYTNSHNTKYIVNFHIVKSYHIASNI